MSQSTPSAAGSPDYVTDVPYLRTFSNALSPAALRFAAALNGFAAPPAHDFDYLELGSGNGDTLVALASAYPRARFVGVDINPDHVAFATDLAVRAGVDNVTFLVRDFAQLLHAELPAFDFVCMYGLLSWISPDKRKSALELAAATLKTGGLLFAGYNAMPGWSSVEPMRRLMLDAAAGAGSSLERAQRGLSVARLLDSAGAHYFTQNPSARLMLGATLQNGLAYAVHEYFHAEWHPFYFEDLASEMAAQSLYFVGQLPVYLNYRDLVIPAQLKPLFQGITDRVAFERLKDYAINEFFRRDVYVKGAERRSDDTTRDFLDTTLFSTIEDLGQVKRSVKLPNYTLEFVGPIFDELLPALVKQGHTVSELAKMPGLAPFGVDQIRNAVLHLALGEQLWPLQMPLAPLAPPGDGPFRASPGYNQLMIEQPLTPGGMVVLACPGTGTGIVLSAIEVVCLRALGIERSSRMQWLHSFASKQPLTMHVQGKPVEGLETQVDAIAREVEQFSARRLPKLLQLGVLDRAS